MKNPGLPGHPNTFITQVRKHLRILREVKGMKTDHNYGIRTLWTVHRPRHGSSCDDVTL